MWGGVAALSDGGRDTSHYDDEGDSIHVVGEMNEGDWGDGSLSGRHDNPYTYLSAINL